MVCGLSAVSTGSGERRYVSCSQGNRLLPGFSVLDAVVAPFVERIISLAVTWSLRELAAGLSMASGLQRSAILNARSVVH